MDDDLGWIRVVGVSHCQAALERCAAGQVVRFAHEADNPHDPLAIQVRSSRSIKLGYLPRLSWAHKAVHERGLGLAGTIASMGYSRNCLLGIRLSVALTDDELPIVSFYPDQPAPEPPPGGFRSYVKTPSDVARLLRA